MCLNTLAVVFLKDGMVILKRYETNDELQQ